MAIITALAIDAKDAADASEIEHGVKMPAYRECARVIRQQFVPDMLSREIELIAYWQQQENEMLATGFKNHASLQDYIAALRDVTA